MGLRERGLEVRLVSGQVVGVVLPVIEQRLCFFRKIVAGEEDGTAGVAVATTTRCGK